MRAVVISDGFKGVKDGDVYPSEFTAGDIVEGELAVVAIEIGAAVDEAEFGAEADDGEDDAEADDGEDDAEASAEAVANEVPAKKKRGRKPKVKADAPIDNGAG